MKWGGEWHGSEDGVGHGMMWMTDDVDDRKTWMAPAGDGRGVG